MRRYSILHPLALSFFSKELYQDVARHWKGTGFLYLFLLLALAWTPSVVRIHVGFNQWVEKHGINMMKDLPRIIVTKGVVQTDPPGRHEIKEPESGEVFLILDASIESINLDEYPTPSVVLTRTKLVMKQKDRNQTRIHDLAGLQEFSMDRNDAERWLRAMGRWLALAIFPFLLLGSFIYRICQALLYGAVGLAFRGSAGASMDYITVLRLACVAVTPAVLVDAAMEFSPVKVPMWWLICFLIAMYYLWFGVQAAKEAPAAPAEGSQAPPPIAG